MPKAPSIPDDLTDEEKRKLWIWTRENAPELCSRKHLRFIIDEMFDYWRGEGKAKKDWLATARNRIRALHAQGRDPLKRITGEAQSDEAQRMMDNATRRSQMDVERTKREAEGRKIAR